MIVDEDSNYISGLRKGLIQAGHEVIYWDDGKKALELTKSLQPDLIVADVDLPQIEGEAFFKEIKVIPELKNTFFIFLSSQKRVDDRIKIMELGVDDFITKPFYVEEVIARIENLLNENNNVNDSNIDNQRGFSGDIAEMNLIDLIQTLEVAKKSAIIKLRLTNYYGTVYIQDGDVVDATLEDFSPEEALSKIFLWKEGNFTVEMVQLNHSRTIVKQNKELISEALKRMSYWEKVKSNLPPLNTVFTVSPMASTDNSISGEEKELLFSINGSRMIYDIVFKSPFDDIKALEIVDKLYQKGFLQETIDNFVAEPEDYLARIKNKKVKYKSGYDRISYIFSKLLQKFEEEKDIKVDRRRDERRQFPERRRFERRKDRRIVENKIYLDRTELLLIREKLA